MPTLETLRIRSSYWWGAQLVKHGTWSCLILLEPMTSHINVEKMKHMRLWWRMMEIRLHVVTHLPPTCSSCCSTSWSSKSSWTYSSRSLSTPSLDGQNNSNFLSKSTISKSTPVFGQSMTRRRLVSLQSRTWSRWFWIWQNLRKVLSSLLCTIRSLERKNSG